MQNLGKEHTGLVRVVERQVYWYLTAPMTTATTFEAELRVTCECKSREAREFPQVRLQEL